MRIFQTITYAALGLLTAGLAEYLLQPKVSSDGGTGGGSGGIPPGPSVPVTAPPTSVTIPGTGVSIPSIPGTTPPIGAGGSFGTISVSTPFGTVNVINPFEYHDTTVPSTVPTSSPQYTVRGQIR